MLGERAYRKLRLLRCADTVEWRREGTGLAPSMFGDDEGDVVVLFVGAEALDFVNDGS